MENPNRKEMNFEVQLLPVISLLAVLIGFLLLTAVWVNVGTIDVNQAFGETQGQASEEKEMSLWVKMEPNGELSLTLKDWPAEADVQKEVKLNPVDGSFNWQELETYAQGLASHTDYLSKAFVLPDARSRYEDVIRVMDVFRTKGVKNIGISPL